MSELKEAVIRYVRIHDRHAKAEEYAKKKQKEKMQARDNIANLIPRNAARIVPVNGELVLIENGPNGVQFRKAVFVNE